MEYRRSRNWHSRVYTCNAKKQLTAACGSSWACRTTNSFPESLQTDLSPRCQRGGQCRVWPSHYLVLVLRRPRNMAVTSLYTIRKSSDNALDPPHVLL